MGFGALAAINTIVAPGSATTKLDPTLASTSNAPLTNITLGL